VTNDSGNPFKLGDPVVFVPDKRTVGWYQHAFDRWGIHPGYEGRVTRVESDQVEIDHKKESSMHWSQFRPSNDVSMDVRMRIEAEYRNREK
jgi:hypothetical protein